MALLEIFTEEQILEYTEMLERVKREAVELSNKEKQCVVMTSESPYSIEHEDGEMTFYKLITDVYTVQNKPVGFAQASFTPYSETVEVEIDVDEYLDLINEINKEEDETE